MQINLNHMSRGRKPKLLEERPTPNTCGAGPGNWTNNHVHHCATHHDTSPPIIQLFMDNILLHIVGTWPLKWYKPGISNNLLFWILYISFFFLCKEIIVSLSRTPHIYTIYILFTQMSILEKEKFRYIPVIIAVVLWLAAICRIIII